MDARSLAEHVAGKLSPYLGSFNAQVAVRTFSRRAFDITPEHLTSDHLPGLLEAMRPMLNTLAGRETTGQILDQIQREVA